MMEAPVFSNQGRGFRTVGTALLRFLGGVIAFLLAIPVILLPFTTSVPAVIWIPLAMADLALLILPFRVEQTGLAVAAAFTGLITVGLLAVLASQVYATTPAITDDAGDPIPGSIAVLEKVELGGTEQWITIRGKDTEKPILLFLSGGPGGSTLPFVRNVMGELEDHFVVVNWDQPGAGKSYGAVPYSELTIDRYASDALELIEYLKARFGEDKIYVLGQSWGTVLGIELVREHPELFHAYIGSGQRTSVHEDDVMGYEFALQYAREKGDTRTVEKLERNGPPPYEGRGMAMKNLTYINVLNAYAHEHARGEATGHDLMTDALVGEEYGLLDKVNWLRGLYNTFTHVYPQLDTIDYAVQAPRLEVPVYFIQGRYDLIEMGSLLGRWYSVLDAPYKEIIYFENSGHAPDSWEPARLVDVIVNHVLVMTPSTEAVVRPHRTGPDSWLRPTPSVRMHSQRTADFARPLPSGDPETIYQHQNGQSHENA